MKVIASADFRWLEEKVLEKITAVNARGRSPVLILAPTRRLVRQLRRRLVDRVDAALGVYFFTHKDLAYRALEFALIPPPRALPGTAKLTLLERLARAFLRDPSRHRRAWERLHSFAGARQAVLSSLNDLRDAGVTPEELQNALDENKPAGFLAPLYAAYTSALGKTETTGWTDDAGIVTAALPHVGRYFTKKGIGSAIHYGAYELIGRHVEMLREIDQVAALELFAPAAPVAPAYAYARDALVAMGVELPSSPPASDDALRAQWLRQLYDADAEPDGIPPTARPALEVQHAQGPAAELYAAVLRALVLHARDGVPWDEMLIVARTLSPYQPYLKKTFADLGVPLATSAQAVLRRSPRADAFLALLEALASNLERRAVIALFRKPAFRAPVAIEDREDVNRWDRWTREAQLVGGAEAWQGLAAALLARRDWGEPEGKKGVVRRRVQLERHEETALALLSDLIGRLETERAAWREARTTCEHHELLSRWAEQYVAPIDTPDAAQIHRESDAVATLLETLSAIAALEAVSAADVNEAAVLEWLTTDSQRARLPITDGAVNGGGLEVVDLMQARGLNRRVIIWVGFHGRLFPRRPTPDPYLTDAIRDQLRKRTGKALARKEAAAAEEKLLLALTLSLASERFVLSFQRAAADGSKEARSSALREVARAFTGSADVAALVESGSAPENLSNQRAAADLTVRVPAHPVECARVLAKSPRFGLLAPRNALVAEAVRARRPVRRAEEVLRSLEARTAARAATLWYSGLAEEFGRRSGAIDALTGTGVPARRYFSATAIERLARCPMSFFLRFVLAVRELEDEVTPGRLEARVLGDAVHNTLDNIYRTLRREGCFEPLFRHEAARRGLELLDQTWEDELRRSAGGAFDSLPGLFGALRRRWREPLERFLKQDLEAVTAANADPVGLEAWYRERVPLPGELELRVRSRCDRVLMDGAGNVRVDDYKSSGSLERRGRESQHLRGLELQLPIYRELVAASLRKQPLQVEARLLGVGPDMGDDPVVLKEDEEIRAGILDTVAVVWRLAQQGQFPLCSDQRGAEATYCRYCSFRRTCRRNHEPTLYRLRTNPTLQDYWDVRDKSVRDKLYTVSDVRAKRTERQDAEDSQNA